jgi:hypothetical protein
MRAINKLLLTGFVMLAAFDVVEAQGPAPPPAQNEVPLDGFSALLLAAGAGYGAKKVLQRKK